MALDVLIRIGGGYALVQNHRTRQFDIASLTKSGHPLRVRLLKGQAEPPLPDTFTARDQEHRGLALDDRRCRMEVWPGGKLPDVRPIPLGPGDHQWLADVPALGGSALAPNWRTRTMACVTLRTGSIRVDHSALATGRFEFTRPDRPPRPRQRLAHGEKGVTCQMSTPADTVALALFGASTTDAEILGGATPVDRYLLSAGDDGQVELRLDAVEEGGLPGNGDHLEEFEAFYTLLDPEPRKSSRHALYWFPADVPESFSPGSECPHGFFDDHR